MRQLIYYLLGHKILNKTVYFVKRYHYQILRYLLRKHGKNGIRSNESIHKQGHGHAKRAGLGDLMANNINYAAIININHDHVAMTNVNKSCKLGVM